jgi:ferredoxin--NADP+ reductase
MNRPDQREIAGLRERHYNAGVERVTACTPRLKILRVRPDGGPVPYSPGQYLTLGVGSWEARSDGPAGEVLAPGRETELLRREYSISHPILGNGGKDLAPPGEEDGYEFYISLPVSDGADTKVRLTPRLFNLKEGDRLFAGKRPAGNYSLAAVGEGDDVLFAATGTGEAPHNAMIWRLFSRGHRGRIGSVICTRRRADQAYREVHERLQVIRPGYRYLTLATREPSNGQGRIHLPEYLAGGGLEKDLGWSLNPERAHVFLCGDPGMIGAPSRKEGKRIFPAGQGMIQLLERRGFNEDALSGDRVNIHYERFW